MSLKRRAEQFTSDKVIASVWLGTGSWRQHLCRHRDYQRLTAFIINVLVVDVRKSIPLSPAVCKLIALFVCGCAEEKHN
jgi:hypothetical protein